MLPELLAGLCARITFPKSMRWGEGTFAFGRPVHWLVGLFGTEVVPFEFAGLVAGRTTRGHRFLAPQTFDLADATDYEPKLAEAHVIVDMAQKKQRMHDALVAAATQHGGVLSPDDFLLQECTSLVEEPFVVPGTIAEQFLELPDAEHRPPVRAVGRHRVLERSAGLGQPIRLRQRDAELVLCVGRVRHQVLRARRLRVGVLPLRHRPALRRGRHDQLLRHRLRRQPSSA